jgi:hypothetical protein
MIPLVTSSTIQEAGKFKPTTKTEEKTIGIAVFFLLNHAC